MQLVWNTTFTSSMRFLVVAYQPGSMDFMLITNIRNELNSYIGCSPTYKQDTSLWEYWSLVKNLNFMKKMKKSDYTIWHRNQQSFRPDERTLYENLFTACGALSVRGTFPQSDQRYFIHNKLNCTGHLERPVWLMSRMYGSSADGWNNYISSTYYLLSANRLT